MAVIAESESREEEKKQAEQDSPVANPDATTGAGAGGEGAASNSKGWASSQRGEKTLKLVLAGDTAVGKSCLITNFLKNSFTEDYEPTVLDVYKGIKSVKKKQILIEIHDTSGDEHLGVNRKVQYQGADCFMICVACNQQSSLENVERWLAEIREVEIEKPVALILTKSDLLAEQIENAVTGDELSEKKNSVGAVFNAETSSKEWEDFNVHKAFNKMLAAAYDFKYELP